MKIYDVEGFPNPARVRIALKEKGLFDAVEFIPVDVMGGEHRSPEFLAKNPSGAVPVLELVDGSCIAESLAITEFIDHLDGAPSLTGSDARQRAEIAMMQARVESGLLEAVGSYFHHATEGLGPDLETDQCADWGFRQKARALDTMRYLDTVLGDRPYLAGDSFSVADITAFTGMGFAAFAKVDVPAGLDNLAAWQDRVGRRPSIAA